MKKKPYIIAFFFFLVDLISKQVIVHVMSVHKSIKVINNFFYITYVQNRGAAWGILENNRILLLIITVVVLYLINKSMNKENLTKMENVAFGMIIGGITGNLFDRIFFKHVIDFLDFKIFGYDYPVFNLADSFIVIGIIMLFIIAIKGERNGKNKGRRK